MTKVAMLIDGGYFLKRLLDVCPDVDAEDPWTVADSIERFVRGYLNHLNDVHKASNIFQFLYGSFCYDAKPYDQKAHMPASKKSIDYAKSPRVSFRRVLFGH